MENRKAYESAKRHVEAKIGFFIHLGVYIVINLLLITINLSTSTQYLWFKWPLIGWGLGLLFHAVGVFLGIGGLGIKERMIEKMIEKEMQKRPSGKR